MQIEDSDAEDEDKGMDRDTIANQLFDADDVSTPNSILSCALLAVAYKLHRK